MYIQCTTCYVGPISEFYINDRSRSIYLKYVFKNSCKKPAHSNISKTAWLVLCSIFWNKLCAENVRTDVAVWVHHGTVKWSGLFMFWRFEEKKSKCFFLTIGCMGQLARINPSGPKVWDGWPTWNSNMRSRGQTLIVFSCLFCQLLEVKKVDAEIFFFVHFL